MLTSQRRVCAFAVLVSGAVALGISCGSSQESLSDRGVSGTLPDGGGQGGAGASSQGGSGAVAGQPAASGASGSAGASGGPSDASADVDFRYDAPARDGTLTQDSACAATSAQAELMPLDVYLMLDRSRSMEPDCNVGQSVDSSWCRAINSIAGFVQDPQSAGMRVALEFFSGDSCDADRYADPAVPLALLDGTPTGHAQTIVAALNSEVPSGSTPTEAALRGMVIFTEREQTAGRIMIGVLTTDGEPRACELDPDALAAIAAAHYADTGIRTFVVGMTGAIYSTLETIAVGGGGPAHDDFCNAESPAPCHYYDVGDGAPEVFIQALKAIQRRAVSCEFPVPRPDAGVVDYENVKLEYTPQGTGTPQQIPNVADDTQCAGGGWYYNGSDPPTTITLCPETCAVVQADNEAKIVVLFGCEGG